MKHWNSGMTGRLCLEIRDRDAESIGGPGQQDAAVSAALADPFYSVQVAQWDTETVRQELREFGAWDAAELADDAENVRRLFWAACCDAREDSRN